jgi:hypothetical protein
MLLLLRAIILTFEYLSVLKSSTAQSLILVNTIDEVLEHCTDAHGIKNRYSISKIFRWKIYIGRCVMMCSTCVSPFLETGIMKLIWTGLRFGLSLS